MSRNKKKFWEMTQTELAEATREFDQEFVADKARPMTGPERAQELGLQPQIHFVDAGYNIITMPQPDALRGAAAPE